MVKREFNYDKAVLKKENLFALRRQKDYFVIYKNFNYIYTHFSKYHTVRTIVSSQNKQTRSFIMLKIVVRIYSYKMLLPIHLHIRKI